MPIKDPLYSDVGDETEAPQWLEFALLLDGESAITPGFMCTYFYIHFNNTTLFANLTSEILIISQILFPLAIQECSLDHSDHVKELAGVSYSLIGGFLLKILLYNTKDSFQSFAKVIGNYHETVYGSFCSHDWFSTWLFAAFDVDINKSTGTV